MEKGLLWLPLLLFFIGLAWIGWQEYQKVEAYQQWAQDFEQAKYDIYAILGKKGSSLTWGKPFREKPKNLQTFSLEDVDDIELRVNEQIVDLNTLPSQGKPYLCFHFSGGKPRVDIPFTEIPLAAKWLNYLTRLLVEVGSSEKE